MLNEIQKRVMLARKINESEHASQKLKYDKSWMIKTAEEMDLIMSESEEDTETYDQSNENNSKLRNLKVQLRELLKVNLMPTRLKKQFYSGAGGVLDEILVRNEVEKQKKMKAELVKLALLNK